jgi:hypothetical protein
VKLALTAVALALGGLFHGATTRVQVVAKE